MEEDLTDFEVSIDIKAEIQCENNRKNTRELTIVNDANEFRDEFLKTCTHILDDKTIYLLSIGHMESIQFTLTGTK